MKLNQKELEILDTSVEDCNFEPYYDYSGRGMYSKSCYGFTIDQFTSPADAMLRVICNLAENSTLEPEETLEFLQKLSKSRANQDSMGLGSIVYFQNLEMPDDLEEEE